MQRLILSCCLLVLTVGLRAAELDGLAWLNQADSLRQVGQDAAALDFLTSAEQQFRRAGHPCWVARFAERKARIHLDWRNPAHAIEALSAALMAAGTCPEVEKEATGWRYALAQAKLDVGSRDEARWILQDLAARGGDLEGDLGMWNLATESMGRLAWMSFEEGDFLVAMEDFNRWSTELGSMGRHSESLDALGWAAVSSELEGETDGVMWNVIRDHPQWGELSVRQRASKASEWAEMLLGAGRLAAFDALSEWPWAAALERAPGSVDPLLETRWALMRARRFRKEHAAQALAASLQAELAARTISNRTHRDEALSEALRYRADILAGTGAHGPAYFALHEADSLSLAAGRADRARTGMFESEPWLTALGDARTRMETERMAQWRSASTVLAVLLFLACAWMWRFSILSAKLKGRLRRLQQEWLPGRQHQVRELALSGARLAEAAQSQALPADLKREMAEFGRLAALCAQEVRHEPINLRTICLALAEGRQASGTLDWSLREEVPYQGDEVQLRDFLGTLIAGLGQGGCRMSMQSTPEGLEVAFDEFTERGWWRQAMTLFAGDGEARHWSMVRLRCDRLGGALNLDCDAAGARRLEVALPVYSA